MITVVSDITEDRVVTLVVEYNSTIIQDVEAKSIPIASSKRLSIVFSIVIKGFIIKRVLHLLILQFNSVKNVFNS